MARRVSFGGASRHDHGRSVGSEAPRPFSGVRRVAPGLQTQPDELLVANYGLTKTATLMLVLRVPKTMAAERMVTQRRHELAT